MNRRFYRIRFLVLAFLSMGLKCISVSDYDWAGNCRLVIHEIKLNSKNEEDRKIEFVELAKICNTQPRQEAPVSVKNFYLVFINGLSKKIVMVCTLDGQMFESGTTEKLTYFFLVGTKNVPKVSMDLSKCKSSQEVPENSFPKANESPIGIALVKLDRSSRDFLEITDIPMSQSVIQSLKRNMRDFYVYEQNNKPQICGLFDNFYSGEQERYKNSMFRIYQTNNKDHDFSLNRCKGGTEPNHNTLFLSRPSPGELNFCNEAFEFNLVNVIHNVVLPHNLPAVLSVQIAPETNCHNFGFKLPQFIDDGLLDAEYTYLHNQAISKSLPNGEKTWKETKCENIAPDWITNIKQFQSDVVRVQDLLRPDTCYWFTYVFNPADPKFSPVTCSLCTDLKNKNILKEKITSDIWDMATSSSGSLLGHEKSHWNTKKTNWEKIKRHNENSAHQIALQIKEADRLGLKDEKRKEFLDNTEGAYYKFYAATERFLTLVYTTIKSRVPFNSFPYFSELMAKLNVNVGLLHQTKQGAKAATLFLSEQMHTDLLSHLNTVKPKFSLICDSSLDRSGIDNLVVLLHVVYPDMTTKTKFYKFITLEGTSGKAIFKKLQESIAADGLEGFFKASMVGLTTDGAKNMKNTFNDEFLKWANLDVSLEEKKYFFHVWCGAHRIELTIKNALKAFPFVKNIDSTINDLYVEFNSIHQRNRAELKKMQLKFEVSQFTLAKDYPIRFIASKRKCLGTVLDNLQVLMNTLRNMNLDVKKYLPHALAKFSSMLLRITDKINLVHLAFFADVADVYTVASEAFQRKDITIIDQTRIVDKLVAALLKLADNNGPRLNKLLGQCKCYSDDDTTVEPCKLKHFEKVGTVEIGNIRVVLRDINSPKLSENRIHYLHALNEEIENYFSPVMEQNFKILEPSQLRLWISSAEVDVVVADATDGSKRKIIQMPGATYAKEALERLNRWFKWSPPRARVEQIFEEYKELITKVTSTPEYKQMKTKSSVEFWKFYFNYHQADVKVLFTPHLIQAIQTCLAVAGSSAGAERYFSLYNHVKTAHRYNLAAKTVDALVRVAHNEDVNVKTFDGLKLAALWSAKYARTDDAKFIRTNTDPKDVENEGWFSTDPELPINVEDEIVFGDEDEANLEQATTEHSSEVHPLDASLVDGRFFNDFNIRQEAHEPINLLQCVFVGLLGIIICMFVVLTIKGAVSLLHNNNHVQPAEEELQFIHRQQPMSL